MGQLVFQATAGGQVALVGPNPSSNFSLNVPAVNGNLVTTGDTGTVTNTMLASSAYTAPGTIGSGTPNSGAFTTLSASSTVSGTGFSTYLASPPAIGGTTPSTGKFTSVTNTGLTSGYVVYATTGGLETGSSNLYFDGTNLGIGTSSPSGKLNVAGSAATNLTGLNLTGTTTGYNRVLFSNTTGGGQIGIESSVGGTMASGTTAYATVVGDYANNPLQFITNNTVRATIDSSGKVGIGTNSPDTSYRLTVDGSNGNLNGIRVQGGVPRIAVWGDGATSIGNGPNYYFQNVTGPNVWAASMQMGPSSEIIFFQYPNGSWGERMRIDSSGNLLVGGTTQYAKLTVASSTANGYNYASNSIANQPDHMLFLNGGTTVGSIQRFGGSAVVYNTTSDRRLKSNIADATPVLNKLMDVKVRQFDWTEGNLHQEAGFIAQELEPILSGVVTKGKTESDIWQLDYSRVTPYLVKAIQEQQAIIEQLKAKVGL